MLVFCDVFSYFKMESLGLNGKTMEYKSHKIYLKEKIKSL